MRASLAIASRRLRPLVQIVWIRICMAGSVARGHPGS
jgi:hypothetical protein